MENKNNNYNYAIRSKSIVFHEYDILHSNKVIHKIRASEQEMKAILQMFNLIERCASENPNGIFPLTIIQEDMSSTIFGPTKDNSWGPILKGPSQMVNNLFAPLLNAYNEHKKSIKTKPVASQPKF